MEDVPEYPDVQSDNTFKRNWGMSPRFSPRREFDIWGGQLQTLAQQSEIKILSDNRSAGHNYHLLDRYEAGLVLTGTEVKAAKTGKIQLKESYAEIAEDEAWLMNAHISEYSHGNIMNHVPVRKRKLLLHRSEIEKLRGETREKGLTVVPTKLYLKSGRIKVEIAVAKGKKFHDKREAIKAREMQAEAKAAMARRARE
jgi:SsrA-binding protein